MLLTTVALLLQTQALAFPSGLIQDGDGNILVADQSVHKVFRIDARTGAMTVIAGTGEPGFSGDGGPATQAQVRNPEWLVLDAQGNLILADRGNYRVRRIDARTGVITTIAGTGRMGFAGDGGPATQADMTHAFGLAYDGQGNLYVFDTEVHRIRRIDAATRVITTVVGNGQPPTTESSRPTAT